MSKILVWSIRLFCSIRCVAFVSRSFEFLSLLAFKALLCPVCFAFSYILLQSSGSLYCRLLHRAWSALVSFLIDVLSFACLAQALHQQPHAYVRANDRDAPAARQLLADALQAVRGLSLTYWQDPTTYLKTNVLLHLPCLQNFPLFSTRRHSFKTLTFQDMCWPSKCGINKTVDFQGISYYAHNYTTPFAGNITSLSRCGILRYTLGREAYGCKPVVLYPNACEVCAT